MIIAVQEAIFIKRLNRFVALVTCQNKITKVHLNNTGKLEDLLKPGVKVLCRPINGKCLKWRIVGTQVDTTRYTLIDTALQERYVELLLKHKKVPGWEHWQLIRRQPSFNGHRWDFLVKDDQGKLRFLEVKSAVFYFPCDGSARYPDTITLRGQRHIECLLQFPEQSALLFVAAHPLATHFKPHEADPKIVHLVQQAINKIPVNAIKLWLTTKGKIYHNVQPLPIVV